MINKIITMLAAISVLFGATVCVAETDVSFGIAFDGNIIIVAGKTEKSTSIALTVTKKGVENPGISDLYAVKEGVSLADGSFSFDFEMLVKPNEYSTGEYTAFIKSASGEKRSLDFYYVSNEERTLIINRIKTAVKPEEIQTIVETYPDALNVMGVRMPYYAQLTNKLDAITVLIENTTISSIDEATFKTMFNKAMLVSSVKNASAVSVVDEALSLYNPSFNSTNYSDITSGALKTWICENILTLPKQTKFSDFEEQYKISNSLYFINNARYSELEQLLSNDATLLSLNSYISYTQYQVLASDKKIKANERLATLIASNPVANISKLKEYLTDAVNTANKPESSSRGSVSGGGGGSYNTIAVSINDEVKETPASFIDLSSVPWAVQAINALKERGIVNGYGDGTFNSNGNITREEFVKIIVTAFDLKGDTVLNFTDANMKEWYYPYISTAFMNDIIKGETKDLFGIGDILTRQDMAAILCRVVDKKQILLKRLQTSEFDDSVLLSEYAKESVQRLHEAGIISGKGDNMFRPMDYCTRAEVCKVVYGIMEGTK